MSKIIDRATKGSEISQAENDANLDSLHGINFLVSGTTATVDIDNQGDTVECTSASATTITLDAISTISTAAHTTDYKVTIFAAGAGGVTVANTGADTFSNGNDTIKLYQGQSITLQIDNSGAIWNIISSGEQGEVLLDVKTASASSTVEFTNFITDEYDVYKIELLNVVPSATSTLYLNVSEDGGSTWEQDAAEYIYSSTTDTNLVVSASNISAAAGVTGVNGELSIYSPASSIKTVFNIQTSGDIASTGYHSSYSTHGRHDTAIAVDGIRFLFSTGNIASGTFKLYGIK